MGAAIVLESNTLKTQGAKAASTYGSLNVCAKPYGLLP